MFRYLESQIQGTASPGPGAPPPGLLAFYWQFRAPDQGLVRAHVLTSLALR
jgi:hypothetical protein